jgi:hypothetical protein
MTYVAKISLPGYDVKIATPEQCVIHSSYPPLKAKVDQPSPHIATLVVDFTATVTQGITHTLLTIPHEYGYTPLLLPNIVFNDGSQLIVGLGYAAVGVNLVIRAFADDDNFYVTIYDNFNWTSNAATLQVSYYIFAEDGS